MVKVKKCDALVQNCFTWPQMSHSLASKLFDTLASMPFWTSQSAVFGRSIVFVFTYQLWRLAIAGSTGCRSPNGRSIR